jgi:hypothetical protein
MSRRARLLAYARWQAADFVVERLPAIVVITAAFTGAGWLASGAARDAATGGGPDAGALALRMFANLVATVWFPVVIVASNQVISGDRASGRFRLLFAKPVSTRRYYVQAYAVNGVLFVAAMALLLVPAAAVFQAPRGAVSSAIAVLAAAYLAIGGGCFFFSVLTRLDWFFITVVAFVQLVLHHNFGEARWTRWLPPFHLVGSRIDALGDGQATDWRELGVLALMGVVAVALGVWIIRRRPLAT